MNNLPVGVPIEDYPIPAGSDIDLEPGKEYYLDFQASKPFPLVVATSDQRLTITPEFWDLKNKIEADFLNRDEQVEVLDFSTPYNWKYSTYSPAVAATYYWYDTIRIYIKPQGTLLTIIIIVCIIALVQAISGESIWSFLGAGEVVKEAVRDIAEAAGKAAESVGKGLIIPVILAVVLMVVWGRFIK